MDPALFSNLPNFISQSRLEPYLNARSGDLKQALRLYTWNIEASASLWGELHVLEISLRNTIHDRMIQQFGKAEWWTDKKVKLTYPQKIMLKTAVKNANENATRKKRTTVPEDVVANSFFAFWTAFLGPAGLLQFETLYWQPFLKYAFPNFTGSRKDLFNDFDHVRLLRNRIAHHEPICMRFLIGDHNRILRIAGYINNDIAQYIKSHSRIIESLERRDSAVIHGAGTRF